MAYPYTPSFTGGWVYVSIFKFLRRWQNEFDCKVSTICCDFLDRDLISHVVKTKTGGRISTLPRSTRKASRLIPSSVSRSNLILIFSYYVFFLFRYVCILFRSWNVVLFHFDQIILNLGKRSWTAPRGGTPTRNAPCVSSNVPMARVTARPSTFHFFTDFREYFIKIVRFGIDFDVSNIFDSTVRIKFVWSIVSLQICRGTKRWLCVKTITWRIIYLTISKRIIAGRNRFHIFSTVA